MDPISDLHGGQLILPYMRPLQKLPSLPGNCFEDLLLFKKVTSNLSSQNTPSRLAKVSTKFEYFRESLHPDKPQMSPQRKETIQSIINLCQHFAQHQTNLGQLHRTTKSAHATQRPMQYNSDSTNLISLQRRWRRAGRARVGIGVRDRCGGKGLTDWRWVCWEHGLQCTVMIVSVTAQDGMQVLVLDLFVDFAHVAC